MARKAARKGHAQGNATVVVKSTWRSLLGSKQFGRGFREVKAGIPFNDDGLQIHEQWPYERGRLFGVVYNGQLKQGRTVLMAAIRAAIEAHKDKAFT